MDLDLLSKAFGLLTATIALVTASVAYRQKRLEAHTSHAEPTSNASTLRVVDIKYAEPKRWPWIVMKWATVPLGIISLLFCLGFAYSAWQDGSFILGLVTSYWAFCTGVFLYAFKVLRRDPWRVVSKTHRRATVTVQGTLDAIFDRCEHSLRALDARITELNRLSHYIHERTSWTWRSFARRLR